MNRREILSLDALHATYGKVVMLGVLVGDFTGPRVLRLARRVWERHPAFFVDFASALADVGDARQACFDLAYDLRDVPGAWDTFAEARAIAANEPERV
jgi:hypothetical protein